MRLTTPAVSRTYLNRHPVGVDLEGDLLPGDLPQPVVGNDGPGSGVGHRHGSDPQRSVGQLADPVGVLHLLVLELPPVEAVVVNYGTAAVANFKVSI